MQPFTNIFAVNSHAALELNLDVVAVEVDGDKVGTVPIV